MKRDNTKSKKTRPPTLTDEKLVTWGLFALSQKWQQIRAGKGELRDIGPLLLAFYRFVCAPKSRDPPGPSEAISLSIEITESLFNRLCLFIEEQPDLDQDRFVAEAIEAALKEEQL